MGWLGCCLFKVFAVTLERNSQLTMNPALSDSLIMRNKALDSLKAAQQLIDAKMHTESIHCAYYALLQMMKHSLSHCKTGLRPIKFAEQDMLCNGRSSHAVLLELVSNYLCGKDKVQFKENFRLLKADRVRADYSEYRFNAEESTEYLQRTKSTIEILKKVSDKIN